MPSKRKQPVVEAPATEPDLGKLKVTELREELTKLGLSTSGNKAELIARLKEQGTTPPDPKKAKEEEEEVGEEKSVVANAGKGKKSDEPGAGKEPAAEMEIAGDQKAADEGIDAPALDPAKLKVAELKEELSKMGLETSGNKAALVARLASALAGNTAATSGAAATGTSTTATAAAPLPPQQPADVPAPEMKGKRGAKGKKVVAEVEEKPAAESAQEETDFSKAVKALGAVKKQKVRQAKVDSGFTGGPSYTVVNDWDCMLNQTNIGQNNNKFYIIQLLNAPFGKNYILWTRWGRVGEPGQSKMDHYSSWEDAKKNFCKKFKEKTQNAWEDRQNFQPRSGKYTLLEMDDDDEDTEVRRAFLVWDGHDCVWYEGRVLCSDDDDERVLCSDDDDDERVLCSDDDDDERVCSDDDDERVLCSDDDDERVCVVMMMW